MNEIVIDTVKRIVKLENNKICPDYDIDCFYVKNPFECFMGWIYCPGAKDHRLEPCQHITDKGCGIYKNRPIECKMYDCRRDSRMKGVSKLGGSLSG